MRPSTTAVASALVLVAASIWITRQAKTLEQDLDGSSRKIALLDKPAPDFHQKSLDGRSVSLSDYHGKKLVLAFLAGWNNASHAYMILLHDLYQNNHQANSDFDVVAISLDDDRAGAQSFADASKVSFPMLFDQDRAITNAYQIQAIPAIIVVDGNGKVTYGMAGPNQRGQNELAQQIGISPRELRMEMRSPNGRGN